MPRMRPEAVATSASDTPAASSTSRPVEVFPEASTPKELMMPMTVPSSPIMGDNMPMSAR